jgi:hypothetical protein
VLEHIGDEADLLWSCLVGWQTVALDSHGVDDESLNDLDQVRNRRRQSIEQRGTPPCVRYEALLRIVALRAAAPIAFCHSIPSVSGLATDPAGICSSRFDQVAAGGEREGGLAGVQVFLEAQERILVRHN